MMRVRMMRSLGILLLTVSMALWLTDCERKLGGVEYVGVEKMQNGYLFRIRTEHPVGDVSAFVGPGNWLLVTVVDSLLDTTRIAAFRSSLVDTVEVRHFPSAFQFSLHFTTRIDRVEVVHDNPGREILISVFRDKEEARASKRHRKSYR